MRVIWSPSALQQLVVIHSYIAQHNPAAADNFIDALVAAGDALVSFPDRGRPVSENLRELTLVRPYVIRYRVVGDVVHILRVRHGAQRPD